MKKVIGVLAALVVLVFGANAFGALYEFDRMKTKLNLNVVPSDGKRFRLGDQLTNKKIQVMKVSYDVARDGGTIADHILKDVDGARAIIPDNALVLAAYLDVLTQTTVAENGPKLGFRVGSNQYLRNGVSHAWYWPGGFTQILPIDGTTIFKTSADSIVYATVVGGALNGGTMNLFIEYLLSD